MEKKKHLIIKNCIIGTGILSVIIIAALSLHGTTAPVSQAVLIPTTLETCFTTSPVDTEPTTETLSEEQRNQILLDTIDQAVSDWFSGKITFENAASFLFEIQELHNTEVTDYAKNKLALITVENDGNCSLDLAQKFLGVKNYVQVFKNLNKINQSYSKYDSVLELYDTCTKRVLQAVATPKSKEDFESFIYLLEECNNLYESAIFSDRKTELSDELVIFLDVEETIDAATVQYDSQNIEESFVILALGIEKYPGNEQLATTLVDYCDHYIISITKQAVELCEHEKYKEALLIVENALTEYDCPEFQLLREAIKEEKNFFYRLKNDIVTSFTSFTNGWKEETFDVKQAANNAGAYVVKSGEKLVLGDYSSQNVTLLSFTGNILASLTAADTILDLRDLSYDLVHWGESEYFAVWLAVDVIALLPVVGVVKYVQHLKTSANSIDTASELVDSVADIGKNANNTTDLLDTVSDVTKVGDSIVETLDDVVTSDKVGLIESVKDTLTRIFSGYTPIQTINCKLLGTVHEETGVKYVLSKIELSDGRKLKGVFPKFDSYADIQLPNTLYKANFNEQKKECLNQLQEEIKSPWSKLRKNFTEEQLDDIANGILPEGFTWHHNEQEGLMQLVDSVIHDKTAHTGGMKLWGIGHK